MGNRSPIVIEGFLLQARNMHLFIPIFLVVAAYTILSTLGYYTVVEPLLTEVFHRVVGLWFRWPNVVAKTRIHPGHLVAATTAYLLITAFTVGPAVLAVTVSAAVTACSGEWSLSFNALVHQFLAGVMVKGPFGTALLGHVLHAVACRGAILFSFSFIIALILGYNTSHVLDYMVFPFLLLGHLFALYMEVVCTLAVVVSAAEPAGCFYGVRALRRSWWILAEKTTPAVILVFVKAVVTVVMDIISGSIWVYVYPIHRYYYNYNVTVVHDILLEFVYSSLLYAALQLWFVCATTLYYYQRRRTAQRVILVI